MASYGLEFGLPTMARDGRAQAAGASALGPSQQAVQILSLVLPKFLGARSLAPASLLAPAAGGPGASTVSPESAVLQTFLRSFMPTGGPSEAMATSLGEAPSAAPASPASPVSIEGAGGGGTDLSALINAIVQSITAPPPRIIPGAGPQLPPQIPAPPPEPAPGSFTPPEVISRRAPRPFGA